MKNILIFSTLASQYFAELIAKDLGISVSQIDRRTFGDGELYHRIAIADQRELFGQTAIFVGSTYTDRDFDELEKIGTTLAELGTARRIFIIPFFGYSTMERAVYPGESVAAKINARRLSNIPNSGLGNVFLLLDLHTSTILNYFEGDCLRYELYAEGILIDAIAKLELKRFMFGTADLGKTKWVETFANKFKTDIAFIRKSRHFGETAVQDVIGDVAGRNIVIYDDMTRSGSTLIKAAKAYLKNGAANVYAVLSHLALNNEKIIAELEESPIAKIISTNSHPMSQNPAVKKSKKISTMDASSIFTDVIKKIL